MSRAPLVSVCIPTYNAARFVVDAIESVLHQEFRDFELLIFDNCSTDDTLQTIRRFSDPRMTIHVNPRNLGLVGNFNQCVEQARGKYLLICCADDVLDKALLEREVVIHESNPHVAWVHSASRVVRADLSLIATNVLPVDGLTAGTRYLEQMLLEDLNGANFSSCLYRTELVRRAGGFDAAYPNTQDLKLWAKLCFAGDVAYIAEPLMMFRKHDANYHVTWDAAAYLRERIRLLEEMHTWPEVTAANFERLVADGMNALCKVILRSLVALRLSGAMRKHVLQLVRECLRIDARTTLTDRPLRTMAAMASPSGVLPHLIKNFGRARHQSATA